MDAVSVRAVARAQEVQDAATVAHENLLRDRAHAEGFADGRAHAMAEADQRVADYVRSHGLATAQRLSQLVDSAQVQLEQSRQVMAQGVLELACEMARQVLRHELTVNPNVLHPVVREALGVMLADSKQATVRLNAVDLEVMRHGLGADFAGLALTLLADPAIAPGGCVIECSGTVVDATLTTRWRRVVANLGLALDWDA